MAQSYIEMCQSNNIKFYFVFCIPHPPLRYCKSFDFHLVASEWAVEIDRSSQISHPVVCHGFKVPVSKPQMNRSFLDIDRSSEVSYPLVCHGIKDPLSKPQIDFLEIDAFKVPFSKLQINRSFLDTDQSSETYHPVVCHGFKVPFSVPQRNFLN